MEIEALCRKVIGAAIEVHKNLGPGLLEKTYEECLCIELENLGIKYNRQETLDINYKGKTVKNAFRIDLLIEGKIILELKSISSIEKVHKYQLLTYLKLSKKKLGLIINFNVILLKNGIVRVIN